MRSARGDRPRADPLCRHPGTSDPVRIRPCGVFYEREANQEDGLHITARVNTAQGVRCRAVADQLPAFVQPEEPTLEDAYLYLISREAVQ